MKPTNSTSQKDKIHIGAKIKVNEHCKSVDSPNSHENEVIQEEIEQV